MTFVIVGFKVSQENSIHYSKAKTPEMMAKHVLKAFEKGADFVSVRCSK
jgi:hypothetical protein